MKGAERVQRRGNDFVRIAQAIAEGARTAQFLVIDSTTYRDSIVCKRWNKRTQEATGPEVFVAKPFECQRTPYDSRVIDGVFYAYSSHLRRAASKNNVSETQVVTVPYVDGKTRIPAVYINGGVLDEYADGSEAPIAVSWWEVSHRCFAAEATGTQVAASTTAGVFQGGGLQHNFGADRDPLVTDDASMGYGEGSMWNNVLASTSWMCIVAATGAAVWVELTGGGGGGGASDASTLTYTPAVLTDWDGNADPGDCDNALDQLAERVDDLEFAPPAHTHSLADITDDGALASKNTVATADIDNSAVTLAKMADLAQDQFIGRVTGSTGVPETATITAAARTVLDDTSVANMVDTLGGAAATGSGGLVRATSPTLVTPALGTPASGTLTNCTGLPTAGLLDDSVTYAKMQNVSATDKVLGRVTAGAGDVEEIATTGSGNVVRATSPTLVTPALGTPASGTLTNCTGLPTAGLVNDAVTYAKMQNVSATDKVLGRSTAGAGDVEEITCTSFARSLLDDADAATARATLGLSAAVDVLMGFWLPFAMDNWSPAVPAVPTLLANGRQSVKFSNTADNSVILEGIVPPTFLGTGTIKLVVQFGTPNTAGSKGIRWDVSTEFRAANDALSSDSFGSLNSATVTDSTTSYGLTVGTITLSSHSGTPAAGAPFRIKLTRDQDHAGDDVAQDVYLTGAYLYEDN